MSVSAPISRCCRARPRSMLTFLSFPPLPLPAAFPGKQLVQKQVIKFFSASSNGEQQAFASLCSCSAGFAVVRACRGCGQQSLRVEQGAWRTWSSDNMRSPCAAHALPQHLHGRVCGVRGPRTLVAGRACVLAVTLCCGVASCRASSRLGQEEHRRWAQSRRWLRWISRLSLRRGRAVCCRGRLLQKGRKTR